MCKACYIHVPFCQDICAYCDFMRCRYLERLADEWLAAIQKEVEEKLVRSQLDTLYIGGGTPSALSLLQLQKLFEILAPYSNHLLEYTMEANVESFDEEKIALCARYGINRISLGVQSLNEKLLKRINRHHTKEDIQKCIGRLHLYGIHHISVDLIYGLPDQSLDIWKQDVKEIAENFPIDHISLYSLTIEEHSQFGREHVMPCDESLEADMYEAAKQILIQYGYHQYEISNFAKEYGESKHNQMYWNYEDFYGIGAGASGKQHHVRYDNTSNLHTYLHDGPSPEIIALDKEDEMFEMIMMSLRLRKGIAFSHFKEVFGCELMDVYGDIIRKQIDKGMLLMDEHRLFASEKGSMLLNDVLIEFLR